MHHDDEQQHDQPGHARQSQDEAVVGASSHDDAGRHIEEPDPSVGESLKENPVEGADPEHPQGT
jgi:hypothetical protein